MGVRFKSQLSDRRSFGIRGDGLREELRTLFVEELAKAENYVS